MANFIPMKKRARADAAPSYLVELRLRDGKLTAVREVLAASSAFFSQLLDESLGTSTRDDDGAYFISADVAPMRVVLLSTHLTKKEASLTFAHGSALNCEVRERPPTFPMATDARHVSWLYAPQPGSAILEAPINICEGK